MRVPYKAKARKEQIKNLIIKVISEDYTPDQVRDAFKDYYNTKSKSKTALLRYAIDRFHKEYSGEYDKWAVKHGVGLIRERKIGTRTKPHYAPKKPEKNEKPKDYLAFLGHSFDNETNAEILKRLEELQKRKNANATNKISLRKD